MMAKKKGLKFRYQTEAKKLEIRGNHTRFGAKQEISVHSDLEKSSG